MSRVDPLSHESASRCNHLWEPRADDKRIWQACLKCDVEEHVTTHDDALMHNLAYIFREDNDG